MEEKEYLQYPPQEDGLEHKMGLHYARPRNREPDGSIKPIAHGLSHNTIFAACWKHALVMSVDPNPEVQDAATTVVDYVHNAVLQSSVGTQARSLIEELQRKARKATGKGKSRGSQRSSLVSGAGGRNTPPL